jgi:hypothetical protein
MEQNKFFTALKYGKEVITVINVLFFSACLIAAFSGCSDSDSNLATNSVISGVVSTDGESTVAIAAVTDGDTEIENAQVSVNGITLDYGLPLAFMTQDGIEVNVILPVYRP